MCNSLINTFKFMREPERPQNAFHLPKPQSRPHGLLPFCFLTIFDSFWYSFVFINIIIKVYESHFFINLVLSLEVFPFPLLTGNGSGQVTWACAILYLDDKFCNPTLSCSVSIKIYFVLQGYACLFVFFIWISQSDWSILH